MALQNPYATLHGRVIGLSQGATVGTCSFGTYSILAVVGGDFDHDLCMSLLQFLEQLRLQEARRLILGEDLDAASAAYRVGYDDASHFNTSISGTSVISRHATCGGYGRPPKRQV